MAGPDLGAMGLDAAQIGDAHAAAYADCESWLLDLEERIGEVRAAASARASVAGSEDEARAAAWRAHVEALLEAARAFEASVEEAIRAQPAAPGERADAATQDRALQQ